MLALIIGYDEWVTETLDLLFLYLLLDDDQEYVGHKGTSPMNPCR